MTTPICDFVQRYCQTDTLRLHMPGHKGMLLLGMEPYDITEFDGADDLYHAEGIIRQSEANAAELFGSAATFYSTEGSSLCIRAMLLLAQRHALAQGKCPLILAGRNAHKTFVTAAGLLDVDVCWIPPGNGDSYLSCTVDTASLEQLLAEKQPTAVYLTSPDYLGNLADISAVSAICRKHDVLLLVDNAHGAYLRFLPQCLHPLALGADLCCDSAHKTLPVLTGGAYLHISRHAPASFCTQARDALALFGSTSPSYLILQSLDAANRYLAEGYAAKLAAFVPQAEALKAQLCDRGYTLIGDEPLKLTILTKPYGYTGFQLSALLQAQGLMCEFADPDVVVMMFSCEFGEAELFRIRTALEGIETTSPIPDVPPPIAVPEQVMSIREALLAPQERIPTEECEGRILASLNLSCPPAVPIAVCGERLQTDAIALLRYYGMKHCNVVRCVQQPRDLNGL